MSASAPNPSTLLIWGAVGIGAYFVVTRMGAAQAFAAQSNEDAAKAARDAAYANALGGIVGGLGNLFKGYGSSSSWSTGGGQWNNPSAYTAPDYSTVGTGTWADSPFQANDL